MTQAEQNAAAPLITLRQLSWRAPFAWLKLGWRDFVRAPVIGLFYGACFMLMGWALLKVYENAPAYTLALSAGFLLMGPFLCLGLYRVSQRLEQGQKPDFGDSLLAWDTRTGQLAIFGMVLLVLGFMHFFNLYVFTRMRKRGLANRHLADAPPVLPRGVGMTTVR